MVTFYVLVCVSSDRIVICSVVTVKLATLQKFRPVYWLVFKSLAMRSLMNIHIFYVPCKIQKIFFHKSSNVPVASRHDVS